MHCHIPSKLAPLTSNGTLVPLQTLVASYLSGSLLMVLLTHFMHSKTSFTLLTQCSGIVFMLMRSALSQRWLVGMGGSEHIVKIVSSLLDTLVYRPPHPDQESMSSFVPKYAYTHLHNGNKYHCSLGQCTYPVENAQ